MLFENFVIGLAEHWALVSSVGVVTRQWDVRLIPAGEGCSVLHTSRLNLIACRPALSLLRKGKLGLSVQTSDCTDMMLTLPGVISPRPPVPSWVEALLNVRQF